MPVATYPGTARSPIAMTRSPGVPVIKGAAVAALLGTFAVGMAVLGVAFILPRLIGMHWKRSIVAVSK